jgi:putative ABC transport system substrate-binding protein
MEGTRRRLLGLAAALTAVALACAPAHAQQSGKVAHVGFIATSSPLAEILGPVPANPAPRGLVSGLREHGWVEGRNLVLERRSAEGKPQRLPAIVAELIEQHVDVIVVPGGAAAGIMKGGRLSVPVVVAGIDDLVRAGLAKSLAHPGGNVTGVVADADIDTDSRRLELLVELLARKPTKVALIGTKAEIESAYGQNLRAQAEKLGIRLTPIEGANTGFGRAFDEIRRQKPDALFVVAGATAYAFRHQIGEFAASNRLPSACPGISEFTEAGCLMAYDANAFEVFRRAASHVSRILNGAKAGDLPIERTNLFELTLNLRAARTLGISVPPALRARADRVIE